MPKRIKKSCSGCSEYFTTYRQDNYDFCRNCAINGSRYNQNKCPECGDGSGWIKFKNQPPRKCKICVLTKPEIPCFYGCSFTASSQNIEKHYRQKHSLKPKEVNHE